MLPARLTSAMLRFFVCWRYNVLYLEKAPGSRFFRVIIAAYPVQQESYYMVATQDFEISLNQRESAHFCIIADATLCKEKLLMWWWLQPFLDCASGVHLNYRPRNHVWRISASQGLCPLHLWIYRIPFVLLLAIYKQCSYFMLQDFLPHVVRYDEWHSSKFA